MKGFHSMDTHATDDLLVRLRAHQRGEGWAWPADELLAMTASRPSTTGGPNPMRSLMNSYARFAEQAWQTLAPARYQALEDPKAFFSDLGIQAQQMVMELATQLEGPDLPGETYFEKVGRLNAAKMQAEEIVRAELLTPMSEAQEDDDDESIGDPYLRELTRQINQANLALTGPMTIEDEDVDEDEDEYLG